MTKAIAKSVKCRYVKRDNTIKSSNFSMDLDTLDAYSYDWWLFCTKVNDLVIFNNSSYSATTHKHQAKAFKVLGYVTDLTLRHTRGSLSENKLGETLDNEISNVRLEIRALIKTIRRPRTHKAKNNERKQVIGELLKHISKVQSTKKAVL